MKKINNTHVTIERSDISLSYLIIMFSASFNKNYWNIFFSVNDVE